MTYFIFNHRITNEQQAVEAESIAEDQTIIYQGTKQGFLDLGFTESQIGGVKLVGNTLTFDQALFDAAQNNKKQIAQGQDFFKFLKKQLNLSLADRLHLQGTLAGFRAELFDEEFNPCSEADFNELITQFTNSALLQNGNKDAILAVATAWKATVKFS